MFAFIINSLEMVFGDLSVTGALYRYIIIIIRATFNNLIISNAKSIIIGTRRYLVIKKTLFMFRKEFATTSNRRRYYSYNK